MKNRPTRLAKFKTREWQLFMLLCCSVIAIMIFADLTLERVLSLSNQLFLKNDALGFDLSHWMKYVNYYLTSVKASLLPLLVLLMVAFLLSHILQTGIVLTSETLRPQLQRLNPLTGFKRLFQMQILTEFFKILVKLTILLTVAYTTLHDHIDEVVSAQLHQTQDMPSLCLQLAILMMIKLFALSFFIALFDLAYTRWKYLKLYNKRYASSRLKPIVREVSVEMACLSHVDVIILGINNDLVAIQFIRDEMIAPKVVCKADNETAEAILQHAESSQIPVYLSPALVEGLFRQIEVGQFLTSEFHEECSRILSWAYQKKMVSKRYE